MNEPPATLSSEECGDTASHREPHCSVAWGGIGHVVQRGFARGKQSKQRFYSEGRSRISDGEGLPV